MLDMLLDLHYRQGLNAPLELSMDNYPHWMVEYWINVYTSYFN